MKHIPLLIITAIMVVATAAIGLWGAHGLIAHGAKPGPRAHRAIAVQLQAQDEPTLILSHNGKVKATYHFTCGPRLKCDQVEFDWKAGHCPSGAHTQTPPVVVVFTTGTQYDGKPAVAPCVSSPAAQSSHHAVRRSTIAGVNDIEYVPMPSAANGTSTISTAWWTRNGKLVQRILPPQLGAAPKGAASTPPPDGIHVYWSYGPKEHLQAVRLRSGGNIVDKLKVPAGTNQADWYGFTPNAKPGAAVLVSSF